jgi:hypothetical protein
MAIIDQILRLESAANIIKAKTADLGLKKSNGSTITTSENLTSQAEAINNISKGTPVTQTLTYASNAVTIAAGYYGSNSTVSVSIMTAPSVSLSSSAQTISCKDKIMSNNITIPAANTFTTGSSVPSDSTGNDGDLFLIV